MKEGAVQIYRVTKVDASSREPLVLDMLLRSKNTDSAWQSRQNIKWNQGEIPVVSPEGLIELKKLRFNGQDQEDIINLESILNESRHEP